MRQRQGPATEVLLAIERTHTAVRKARKALEDARAVLRSAHDLDVRARSVLCGKGYTTDPPVADSPDADPNRSRPD